MNRPLMPSDLNPMQRSPKEWQELTDKLASGVPTTIEEPAMTARFLAPGKRFSFEFDWDARYNNAGVRLVDSVYKVRFGLSLLSHFSGLARWMLADQHIRSVFLLSKCYPNDDISDFFLTQWFNWVIWHEVGHAACGHLEGPSGQGISSIIEEFGALSISNMPTQQDNECNIRMAYELDADVAALNFYFIDVGHRINSGLAANLYGTSTAHPFLSDIGASFAILFSFWQQLGENSPRNTHPAPVERCSVWFVYAMQALDVYANGDASEHADSLFRGFATMLYTLGQDGAQFAEQQRDATARLSIYKDLIVQSGIASRRQMRLSLDLAGNNIKPRASNWTQERVGHGTESINEGGER